MPGLLRVLFGVVALAAVAPGPIYAQGTPAAAPSAQAALAYSQAQLDQLLAPIALYPDALAAQILAASTYPLEVIEAYRWQQESGHANLKGDQLDAALQDEDWDPSVKSLIPFPQVLRMMNDRLDWMQQLGDAFLSQPGDVMDSIQRLRRAAEKAGTLKSSPQQTVTTQDQDIVIAPANPDSVYVPVYDPTVVYGVWPYPAYPPYYWWPPDFVYGPAFWPGWWWWWPAVAVGYYGYYWGWGHCDWHHHRIYVDHRRYDHIHGPHPYPISGDTWQHDPYHRRGVSYRDPVTAAKYGRSLAAPDARHSFRGFQPPSGPTTQAPFGGYGSGASARAQSERGRSSQQTIAPRTTAPSVSAPRSYSAPGGGGHPPSGGGFGGGGHGGGHGGGGGHR